MTPQEAKQLWPFEVEPREVQLEALAAGFGKPGYAFFMRQRLGKTWTAFAEYTLLRSQGECEWCIIICPNSLKEQWKEAIEEVDQFIPVFIYESYYKAKMHHYFEHNKRGGVFIINYESVSSFLEDFMIDPFFSPERVYLIADESTKIKEPSAKMTKACHGLAGICKYKRILSGKPTANSNADLWGQIKFIDATNLNYYQFKHYYVLMGGFRGSQVLQNMNTEHLKKSIEPYSYIAPDKYISGFEKVYEPLRKINLTKDLREQYKKMEDELIFELSSDVKITAPIALVKYLRLQQISSGVAGDINGNQHNLIDPHLNPRIKIIREIMDNEIDHKVIIPCRFVLSAMNVKRVLENDGYRCAMLLGEAPMRRMGLDAEVEKKKFNEGDYNILIGQLQTLSFGHTLCGLDENPCDSMIFYENDFSLLNRSQCESRPEKFGRQRPISYYDMFASKIDKYMIQALVKKEDASMKLMNYGRQHGLRPELSKENGNAVNFDEGTQDSQTDLPF